LFSTLVVTLPYVEQNNKMSVLYAHRELSVSYLMCLEGDWHVGGRDGESERANWKLI
jgi:hypothetical protein